MNVFIFLEGQSEEEFCKNILKPYFEQNQIYITYVIVSTGIKKNGTHFRGGITNYSKIRKDIGRIFNNPGYDLVTTFFDFYGFLKVFPFKKEIDSIGCYGRVEQTEEMFGADLNSSKFLPYLNLHEYEMIYFIDYEITKKVLDDNIDRNKLRRIIDKYENIEEINEDPSNAPSKRLKNICPSYEKIYHSQLITQELSIGMIKNKCIHFKKWIENIESRKENTG